MLNHADTTDSISGMYSNSWRYEFISSLLIKKIFYILYDLQWDQLNKDFQWTSYFENTNINF